MRNKIPIFLVILFSLFTIRYTLYAGNVLAHCPLCVGGAAVGLSLTRALGVDDSIAGVWLAALLGAMSFWLDPYLGRKIKNVKKNFLHLILYVSIFGLTLWSFYALNDYAISNLKFYLINKHAGQIFGLDKLTFGIISGGILFYLVDILDDRLIKRNGKVLFPYQRIIVSLGSMIILSFSVYVLINYFI